MNPRPPNTNRTPSINEEATKSEHKTTPYLTLGEFIEIDNAIHRGDLKFLQKYVQGGSTEGNDVPRVNLSGDPLLNVMIAYGSKTELLLQLIQKMLPENLMADNHVGDTALHLAAAKNRLAVATAMIEKNHKLMVARNKNTETPLLKAALFGSTKTFHKLKRARPTSINDRTVTGATVLHYAIMGNNPELALQIAQDYENLIYSRASKGLAPLQFIVTIPRVFRSSLELGTVKSFLYTFIPLDSNDEYSRELDVEEGGKFISHNYWVESGAKSDKLFGASNAMPSSYRNSLKNYLWIWYLFYVAKHVVFKGVEELEILKKKHVQTMKLISYLARDQVYWDFINKGMFEKMQTEMEPKEMMGESEHFEHWDLISSKSSNEEELISYESLNERNTTSLSPPKEKDLTSSENDLILGIKNLIRVQNNLTEEFKKQIKISALGPKKIELSRWNASPLIVGAKMGLHDFVEQILKVCPQSAHLKDLDGRNVLQVAIKYGHVKIVKIIAEMTEGPNPVLPSWLLSDTDKMENTILHYATETTIQEGYALQMQREIKWFEMVQKLLPADLENRVNVDQKTAQELFIEKHTEMLKSGRKQLLEIGKVCSVGLLAAVVYTTSFNVLGGKDSTGTGPSNNNMTNTVGNNLNDSVGFKLFTHAYVLGLSFAVCSLLLFLSLMTSNYTMGAFRKSLPIKYGLAVMTFILASLSLLVAFTCNIYISIYGGGAPKAKELLPFIIELTGFPILYAIVGLIFGGHGFPFSDVILNTLRQ